jgi:hypothetical protein
MTGLQLSRLTPDAMQAKRQTELSCNRSSGLLVSITTFTSPAPVGHQHSPLLPHPMHVPIFPRVCNWFRLKSVSALSSSAVVGCARAKGLFAIVVCRVDADRVDQELRPECTMVARYGRQECVSRDVWRAKRASCLPCQVGTSLRRAAACTCQPMSSCMGFIPSAEQKLCKAREHSNTKPFPVIPVCNLRQGWQRLTIGRRFSGNDNIRMRTRFTLPRLLQGTCTWLRSIEQPSDSS